MTVPGAELSEHDLEQLAEACITIEEAARQVDLLRSPPAALRLDRPCTVGDGILGRDVLTRDASLDRWATAAAAGRLTRFVPASGAASRMFDAAQTVRQTGIRSLRELRQHAEGGDAKASAVAELIDRAGELPFADALTGAKTAGDTPQTGVSEEPEVGRFLDAMLTPEGLDLPALPKGLIPFHLYASGPRTAFEEHLFEGSELLLDRNGVARFHFTVPEDRHSAFEALARLHASRHQSGLRVGFSFQEPLTHTLAVGTDGNVLRRADGRLLLRPGGHGALLRNLERCAADLVLIKNIDNIAPERRHGEIRAWHKRMVELLLRTERRSHRLQEALESAAWEDTLEDAEAFCRQQLGWAPRATSAEGRRAQILHRLDRPLRICGMVRNEGEPGGGPFWVREPTGDVSLQIVESAQVDTADPDQATAWNAATHFNPVLLALSLRDRSGEPYSLSEFVDPAAVFVTAKTIDGQPARVLEHPGLWNGAMARWNTLFVDVPLVVFSPVKTVLDLLRPAHRALLD